MDIERDKAVSFSGHRKLEYPPQGSLFSQEPDRPESDLREALYSRLEEIVEGLYNEGYTTFLCGMADGFDLLAAEVVRGMRNRYSDIELMAIIPHPAQAEYYHYHDRELYDQLLADSTQTTTLSQYYRPDCFHIRNDFLIDNSSVLVCFFNGTKGGTAYTVKQAIRKGIRVINTY